MKPPSLTIGIEEEYQIIDPQTRELRSYITQMLEEGRLILREQVDLLRRLKELQIDVPVIVVTGHGDVPLAVEAMKIGAAEFLEKPFDDEALLTAVRSALDRQNTDSRRQAERADIDSRLAALSNRERDVLQGLVSGLANKQIAFNLGISPRTVEIYRANLMTKMQASSLSGLVRMALLAGILGSESDPNAS